MLTRQEYVKQHIHQIDNTPTIYCDDCGQEMEITWEANDYHAKPCCAPDTTIEKLEMATKNMESIADHIDNLQDYLYILNTHEPTNEEMEHAYNNITAHDLKTVARTLEYMKNLIEQYRD